MTVSHRSTASRKMGGISQNEEPYPQRRADTRENSTFVTATTRAVSHPDQFEVSIIGIKFGDKYFSASRDMPREQTRPAVESET